MAKKKVAAKKKGAKPGKPTPKKNPKMKEVVEVAEELENILEGLRTSTVSHSRDRIETIIQRLKAIGEG